MIAMKDESKELINSASPCSQPNEAMPIMFTGQQLLQQLAQQQGIRLPEGQAPQMEAQPTVKPEQTPEQQYQDVFHRYLHWQLWSSHSSLILMTLAMLHSSLQYHV